MIKWAQYPAQMEAYPYPIGILRALSDALFRLTQQNWSRDRKLTQSRWCLH